MRGLIIFCLIVATCADKLGYNYQPVGHSDTGLSFNPGSGGSATQDAPSQAQAPAAELEKEFFTFSANDDDFNDPAASNQASDSVKKSLRVIFIKGPDNRGLEDAAASLAKQGADDKTHIYVLQKQADIGDLANKLNGAGDHQSHKPEVHFVKYRTHEDAANAQRQIQAQYDSLGGTSQSHNGGVAPVLNFASQASVGAQGSLNGAATAPSDSYLAPGVAAASVPSDSYLPPGAAAAPSTSYLPPSLFRF